MQISKLARWTVYIALVVLAAWARWRGLGGDYYGDESWYMYLSRDWGREADLVVGVQDPTAHLLYRPVFYAFYFIPAHFGLTATRGVTLLFGVLSVVLAVRLAEVWGAPTLFTALAGACVAFAPNLLRHNVVFFPDTMAGAMVIATALAYATKRHSLAIALMALTVLTKESCAPFAIAVSVLAFVRGDGWRRAAAYIAPLSYVAFAVVFATKVLGARSQGWADGSIDEVFLRQLLIAPAFVPGIIGLVLIRRWEPLALWMVFPVFYVLWVYALGRGVALWYPVAGAPLASASFAVGVYGVVRYIGSLELFAADERRRVLAAAIAVVAIVGLGFRPLRKEAKNVYRRLDATLYSTELLQAEAFIQRHRPHSVHVINCFWALTFSAFRPTGATATLQYVSTRDAATVGSDVTVWCSHDERPGPPEHPPGCELHRTETLAVFSRAPCDSELPR